MPAYGGGTEIFMRKLSTLLTLVLTLTFCSVMPANAANEDYSKENISVISAINNDFAVVDGEKHSITAPLLVFGRAYVDLYSFAALLDCGVDWVPDTVGYFTVSKDEKKTDFTLISQYDDLVDEKYKFFSKDGNIFVSLRELANFAGCPISYDSGIITLGEGSENTYFGKVDTHSSDDYVYKNYPVWAEYVVNPYVEYSYNMMLNDAQALAKMYPDLIKTSSIGRSVENRELLLIEFGRGDTKVFVCGTHHAREYMATTYLMYAIDRYAYAYRTGSMWNGYSPRDILDEITFCIVPMVNPDGVNLVQNGLSSTPYADEISKMKIIDKGYGYSSWKANVHGVDVNWNYDKDWSAKRNKNERGSTGFNGDYPNSEPETAAVSAYVDKNSFEAFLSFHTQGQIFYWSDSKSNPMYIQNAIKKDTGFTPYEDEGTGVGGSFFDYVYRNFDKPTITVELCPYVGNYPYPNSNFDAVWCPSKNILLVAANEIIYRNSLK